jgi:hypothetical protein
MEKRDKELNDIIEEIKKTVRSSSFQQYERMYRVLGLTKLDDLKDTALIMAKIEDKLPNTQKSYFASIVKLLKFTKNPDEYKPLIEEYSKLMNGKILETKPDEKYNEKQKKNLMTREQIEEIRKELISGITNFKNRLNYDILLDYVILSLYTLQPPRRNEYYDMKLVDKLDDIHDENNYLVWGSKKKLFVFQNYKTAWKYGRQMITISKDMENVLKLYLPIRDVMALKGNNNLLVKYGNINLENSNDITRRLNRVLGKKIGASMLRHIYLSEKYGDTLKEMKQDAEALGHSLDEQRDYVKQ